MHIDFVPGVVPDLDKEGMVENVLGRLPSQVWGDGDRAVLVLRRFSGAGGAMVVQIQVDDGNATYLQVVKIGPAGEMSAEHAAFSRHIAKVNNKIFTQILYATDRDEEFQPDRFEALVYGDAAQFAGDPGAALVTLEDVFADASRGSTLAARRAGEAIEDLFKNLRVSLYLGATGTGPKVPLPNVAARLGPDLTLEVLHVADNQGRTVWGVLPGGSKPMRARAIRRAGAGYPDAEPWAGRVVTIDDLAVARHDSGVRGSIDTAIVDLGGDFPVQDGTFQVTGWARETRQEAVMKGRPTLSILHPFAALRAALDVALVRVGGTAVHGDLNARNVLLVGADHEDREGSRPYLIDYRECTDELTLLTDFAWLEINLMRAIAGDPQPDDLIRLQRRVTLAAALFPEPANDDGLDLTPFADLGGPAGLLWPILVRLRWHAYLCYPEVRRGTWLADYSRHLVLAAHRTLKWPGPESTVSLVTAGVAGEWLTPREAFRYWPAEDLPAVPTLLAATARRSPRSVALLLGALTREVDRRGVTDLEDGLTTAANTLVAVVHRSREGAGRELFMELSVSGADGEARPAVEHLTGMAYGILAGSARSGKSAVIREMAFRMSAVAINSAALSDRERHRLPVIVGPAGGVTAEMIARHAPVGDVRLVEDLLHAGCLHVLADDVRAADVADLREAYPRTHLLVTGREPATDSEGWRLRPPTVQQSITFLAESAVRRGVPLSVLRDVLAGQGTARVDELLGTAMGVSLLARYLRPGSRPGSRPGLTDLLDESFAAHATALNAAERIAADQVDNGTTWTTGVEPPLDHGVMERTDKGWSFTHPVYRDYFAGRDPATASARARHLSWQEALRLAVARSGAEQLAATVVDAVRHTDPVFAARLLAMTATTDEAFAREQVTVLLDVRSGHVARRIAAAALRELGEPGIALLCEVALDAGRSPAVRHAAVQPLLDGEPAPGPHPVRLATRLLGEDPQPARLRAAGVRLAVRHRATGLTLLIAAHCDDRAPWSYWQAAHDGLRSLGTVLPRPLADRYRAAAARRLDRLTAFLPRLTTRASYTRAQEERIALLKLLRGRPDVLLAHRNDFEIGGHVADLLPDPSTPDPLTAADVYRILALDQRTTADNERLASALVEVWAGDRFQGARLAQRTRETLEADGGPDRLRWPLRAALGRCAPDEETVAALLLSNDPDDQTLVVAALSAAGFPIDASPAPGPALDEPARQTLLSLLPEPGAGWAAVDFLRAAATASLHEALPLARRLLDDPGLGRMIRLIPHPVYGVLEVSARSEVLAATGYLLTLIPGDPLVGYVESLGVFGGHPSDETGRLIALSYLGQAGPVLDALNGAEPRLHAAARRAMTTWATGDHRNPGTARDTIASRLRTGRHDPAARSTLLELLRELSERSGQLTDVPVHGPR
ncbi:hypothetical protein [Actinoplanes derwentensis]|uniref:hypothetical protein n=1 Tax=Actinoplanes derwentensis TaxID=113562 RepID=UPI0012FE1736|nr:hypothetical protein [Actinoplanes derwentensis]